MDRVKQIDPKKLSVTKQDFYLALSKAGQQIKKPKPSPKQSKT